MLYNNDLKINFLNELTENNSSSAQLYNRIFKATTTFERHFNKDLYSFNVEELLFSYKEMAKNKKYTTINTYNSLIADYKKWALNQGYNNIAMGVCTTSDLKKIDNYKEYYILNQDDIDSLTVYGEISDADYNAVIFIRLLWELNAEVGVEDILRIKISDLHDEKYINVNEKTYEISTWLYSIIQDFAEMDILEFTNTKKRGRYKILTAKKNEGYIFRTTLSKNTIAGTPVTYKRFSNILYQYCNRNAGEAISVNDILISLSLRYMLKNKKSVSEMYSEKVYFKNLPTAVYENVFNKYAEVKFPELYKEYMDFYSNLMEKYRKHM